MTYYLGQVVPLDYDRQPLGDECDPDWYILNTPPQKEIAADAWLSRIGAADVWRPTEKAWRLTPKGKRKRVPYQKPIAPGYLFVLFDREPIWDVLFHRGKSRISRVVSVNSIPYAVPLRALAEMQQVPERIEIERKAAEEAARQARIANQPQPGEKAILCIGPLAGSMIDITQINKGIAHFLMGNIQGTARVEVMKRA